MCRALPAGTLRGTQQPSGSSQMLAWSSCSHRYGPFPPVGCSGISGDSEQILHTSAWSEELSCSLLSYPDTVMAALPNLDGPTPVAPSDSEAKALLCCDRAEGLSVEVLAVYTYGECIVHLAPLSIRLILDVLHAELCQEHGPLW